MMRREDYFEGDESAWPDDENKFIKLPPRPPKVELIHADDELIVVNKPAGIWQDHHPLDEPSVFDLLVKSGDIDETAEPHFLYPIDAPVSGVCALARRNSTVESIEMTCPAIVRGMIVTQEGVIEIPIRRGERGAPLRIDKMHGDPATTRWTLKDRYVGYALLECIPTPALPDVVRAHLQALEIPLVVDPTYGGGSRFMLSSFKAGYHRSARHEERPLIARVSLHVQSIALKHPKTGEGVQFTSPPPKDFKATLHQLDRFGRMP